jgi:hypothetical protein
VSGSFASSRQDYYVFFQEREMHEKKRRCSLMPLSGEYSSYAEAGLDLFINRHIIKVGIDY